MVKTENKRIARELVQEINILKQDLEQKLQIPIPFTSASQYLAQLNNSPKRTIIIKVNKHRVMIKR